MKSFYTCLTAIFLSILISASCPDQTRAWVGLELNGKATGIQDLYEATGSDNSGSLWEFSGRVMYQESFGKLDTEVHWLGQFIQVTGDLDLPPILQDSPFRILDLEKVHHQDDRTALFSEIDRLSLAWISPGLSLTAGRQAISWGEAFYYNIGDIFGAFPITETNRRYKPGIDAVTATLHLGPFSNLSLTGVPVKNESDSFAANMVFPLGSGTCSLTGGRVLEDDKAGAGYTVDISGTQVYGTLVLTRSSDRQDYSQAVAGAQRQVGPYTLVLGEIYHNGWGTTDPDDYPDLILSREYLEGNVLTLGKHNLAFQVSHQVSPLLTLTPAVFANISDGSALLRVDGTYSISNYTDLMGGLFLGAGKRPDNGIPASEYGGVPISVYVEMVHDI
jgi:hypothetical protein